MSKIPTAERIRQLAAEDAADAYTFLLWTLKTDTNRPGERMAAAKEILKLAGAYDLTPPGIDVTPAAKSPAEELPAAELKKLLK